MQIIKRITINMKPTEPKILPTKIFHKAGFLEDFTLLLLLGRFSSAILSNFSLFDIVKVPLFLLSVHFEEKGPSIE